MSSQRNSSARYQKVLQKTGNALAAIPPKLNEIKSSAMKYLALESEFTDIVRQFSGSQEDMSDAWFFNIANSLGHVGRSLACLEKEKSFDNADISLALELARHLDQISKFMVNAADSFSLTCNVTGLSGRSRATYEQRLTTLHNKTADAAFEFYLAAKRITFASGMSGYPGTAAFTPPTMKSSCCLGEKLNEEAVNTDILEEPSTLSTSTEQLWQELDKTEELLALFIIFINALKTFLIAFPAVSLCSSSCSPGLSFLPPPRTGKTGADLIGANQIGYRAWFEVEWDYCCQNICMLYWTDEWVKTIITRHDATLVANNPNRNNKAIAERHARSLAKQVATDIANNRIPRNGFNPPVLAPAAPEC